MNAPVTIAAQLATAAEAVERANKWVDAARPIIKAYFAIDNHAMHPLLVARLADKTAYGPHHKMSPEARAWAEAMRDLEKVRDGLFEMLDGIRDNYLCDERINGSSTDEPTDPVERQAWDDAESHAEDFNAELDRDCVSVDAAVKLVGDEQ